MSARDPLLREVRLWRLDHASTSLRLTRAAPHPGVSVFVGLLGVGVATVAVLGIVDAATSEVDPFEPNAGIMGLISFSMFLAIGLAIAVAGWLGYDRPRHAAISVDPSGVHVRHGRFREERVEAATIERVELLGRRFMTHRSTGAGGARVDLLLAPGPGPEPFVLAMWSLSPDSEDNRAQLEGEALAIAGQIAAYLGDTPVVWRGF